MNRKAIILSIKGKDLSKEEKHLIYKYKPWGIILFGRNIKNFQQVKKLTGSIRKIINDPQYPILIDEEGGRVSRLSNIINTENYSQLFFGKAYEKNQSTGKLLYEQYLESICSILNDIGININTIPVLDILKKNTHNVIGDRSYSNKINTIKKLGTICINILSKNKIASVSKHVPGHGCSNVDTHKKIAIVKNTYNNLKKNDFTLFIKNKSKLIMTAHILYDKIDPYYPATHSEIIIKKLIRNKFNYRGLIISDDISMRALTKDIIYNAKKSIKSGCNLSLYCGGNLKESLILLKNVQKIDSFTIKKTSELYKFLR